MRNRRVGMITLGLALIATGTLSILSLFTNFVDIFTVMKLSPLILVFLGIEILAYSVISNEEIFKIDGWAILLMLILISGTLLTAAAVVTANHFII